MANPIIVACPECQKQLKVPADAQGKKVRCKCGHVFAAQPAAPEKTRPAPAKAKGSSAGDAEHEGGNYGFTEDETSVPRCPHCAAELERADARICLHCGYDLVTRQRVSTKKVAETTASDRMGWLLPGFAAVAGIAGLGAFDLVYCLLMPRWLKDGDWEWVTYGGFRVWVVIATLFGMFYLGKVAVQRLILHPAPPEQEVH